MGPQAAWHCVEACQHAAGWHYVDETAAGVPHLDRAGAGHQRKAAASIDVKPAGAGWQRQDCLQLLQLQLSWRLFLQQQ